MPAVITPRPTNGSHHGTATSANLGAAVVARIGRTPTRATSPRPARPAPAIVSGRGRSPWRSQSHTTMAAGAVYSISSAGPTSIAATAEKYANCVPATGTAPYNRTVRALRRSSPQRPRSARAASGATTSAAMAMRASTTAPGLQPASISPRARAPDSANDAAETTASSSPARMATGALLSLAIAAMTDDNTQDR